MATIGHNARSALLSTLFNAATNMGKGEYDVIAAVKAAGKQEDARQEFFYGFLVGNGGATREQAMLTFAKKWNDAKGSKSGDDVQTPSEFKLMNAAKTAWFRVLVKADLQSTSSSAGNKNAVNKELMKIDAIKLPKKPTVETTQDLLAFTLAYAEVSYNLMLKNKAHKALKGALAEEIKKAVFDHLDCLKAIHTKYAESDDANQD